MSHFVDIVRVQPPSTESPNGRQVKVQKLTPDFLTGRVVLINVLQLNNQRGTSSRPVARSDGFFLITHFLTAQRLELP